MKKATLGYLLLRAVISIFPSLISSLMNLFVRSSSISWHLRRSLKSGLSRKESLNSKVGSPIVPQRQSYLSNFLTRHIKVFTFHHVAPMSYSRLRVLKKVFLLRLVPHFRLDFLLFFRLLRYHKNSGRVTPAGYFWIVYNSLCGPALGPSLTEAFRGWIICQPCSK